MDYYHALQLRAMLAVQQPDAAAFLRHAQRFFSKTFSTPLLEVEALDEEFVLQAYYEEAFSQMDEDTRDEFLEKLLLSPEEREALEKKRDVMEEKDRAFMEQLNKDVKSGKRRGPPPEKPKMRGLAPPVDPVQRAKDIKAAIARGGLSGEPEATPPPKPPAPDIHMSFDDGNLPGIPAEWLDMDPSGATPIKK